MRQPLDADPHVWWCWRGEPRGIPLIPNLTIDGFYRLSALQTLPDDAFCLSTKPSMGSIFGKFLGGYKGWGYQGRISTPAPSMTTSPGPPKSPLISIRACKNFWITWALVSMCWVIWWVVNRELPLIKAKGSKI